MWRWWDGEIELITGVWYTSVPTGILRVISGLATEHEANILLSNNPYYKIEMIAEPPAAPAVGNPQVYVCQNLSQQSSENTCFYIYLIKHTAESRQGKESFCNVQNLIP